MASSSVYPELSASTSSLNFEHTMAEKVAMENALPSLLMHAARSAAVADGVLQSNTPTPDGNKDDDAASQASAVAALAMVAAGSPGGGHDRPSQQQQQQQQQHHHRQGSGGSAAESATDRAAAALAHAQAQARSKLSHSNGVVVKQEPGSDGGPAAFPNGIHRQGGGGVPGAQAQLQHQGMAPPQQQPPKPAPQAAPPTPTPQPKKKGPPLRRGKWTPEEEAYANRLILEFKAGLLPLTDGTTLRTFLSKLLNCDPMRISKKFVGSNCIGKQVFRRRTADINRLTPEQIQASQQELSELERRFLERVAQTNRVKSSSGGGASSNASSSVGGVASRGTPKPLSPMDGGHGVGVGDGGHGVGGGGGGGGGGNHSSMGEAPSPPWLKPPANFAGHQQSAGAAAMGGGGGVGVGGGGGGVGPNSRAAAAGRALLQGAGSSNNDLHRSSSGGLEKSPSKSSLANSRSHGSAGLLAMAEMQRRQQSQQSMLQNAAMNNLAATMSRSGSRPSLGGLNAAGGGSAAGLSGTAMAQIARNASAARMAGLAASGQSMNDLMLKAGLSRDQLGQLAREQQLASSHSLSNMMERQSSFDALMSLDFQSLQSIDNLANLIQTGGGLPSNVPRSGLKNWSMDSNAAAANNAASAVAAAAAAASARTSSGNSSLANARRLASEGRMDSLIRSLSTGNAASLSKGDLASLSKANLGGRTPSASASNADGSTSNASFANMLQNLQGLQGGGASVGSMSNLLGAAAGNPYSAMSLANMLRSDSSTGLTALRVKDGLANRNTSVDDFLSLVASGDIPHQDPHMLNVPLQSVMQQQQSNQTGAQAAATYLAKQQLLAQAANGGNNALSDALAARAAMAGNSGSSSFLNQLSQGSAAGTNALAAAFAQQQQQAKAAQMNVSASAIAAARAQVQQQQDAAGLKRRFEAHGDSDGQGHAKR